MKSLKLFSVVFLVSMLFGCGQDLSTYEDVPFTEKVPRDWEDPSIFNINREAPRANFISYASENSALADNIKNAFNSKFFNSACGGSHAMFNSGALECGPCGTRCADQPLIISKDNLTICPDVGKK